jgi:hypothetical protein
VHTLVVTVENVTARPEVAVAETVNGASPKLRLASAPKAMVWLALATVKLCVTWGAAPYVALPDWSAAIVHVPAATIVTVFPETVQTAVVSELKVTVSPELAVADTVNGGSPKFFPGSAPNVIVWLCVPTVKLRETCGAAL